MNVAHTPCHVSAKEFLLLSSANNHNNNMKYNNNNERHNSNNTKCNNNKKKYNNNSESTTKTQNTTQTASSQATFVLLLPFLLRLLGWLLSPLMLIGHALHIKLPICGALVLISVEVNERLTWSLAATCGCFRDRAHSLLSRCVHLALLYETHIHIRTFSETIACVDIQLEGNKRNRQFCRRSSFDDRNVSPTTAY